MHLATSSGGIGSFGSRVIVRAIEESKMRYVSLFVTVVMSMGRSGGNEKQVTFKGTRPFGLRDGAGIDSSGIAETDGSCETIVSKRLERLKACMMGNFDAIHGL